MKTSTKVNRALMFGFLTTAFSVILPAQLSHAHNKVVVIPMAGDDVPADIEPTAPVAKVDPSQTDYTLMPLTTIDNITGLEWQREDDNIGRNWNDALDYCSGLTLDGKTDWRLPDIVELQSIVDFGQSQPAIDSVAFPNTNNLRFYRSATSEAGNSDSAEALAMNNGFMFGILKTQSSIVRCVR